jgi:UDP-glucose:(heptosyl)LPS alpha-1,3-glucosyltransferase
MRHAASGGTEGYLNGLAAHLATRGHEVTIVCRRHEHAPHPAVRFHVLRSPAAGSAWRMWAFARAVEAHVRAADYDVVYGLGKTWTHDVVRLGGGCHRTYLERAHAATLGPVERVLFPGRLKHGLALRIERRALAPGAYRRVVVNAEMVKRDVTTRHGVPEAAIEVIGNGVDLERFHPRERERGGVLRRELGWGDEHEIVLFLGTGYGRKGLDLLLDAFPALLRARPEARLLVVGRDSRQGAWEARVARAGLGARVRFLGGRRDPEVCYGAADLFALPTRYDPFANATLEALASGLPVVTSTWDGAAELIEARVQGSAVPSEGGAEALAAELVHWSDPARRRAGSLAARALAEGHGITGKLEASERVLREVAERRGS